jgi:hypothetical protein
MSRITTFRAWVRATMTVDSISIIIMTLEGLNVQQ